MALELVLWAIVQSIFLLSNKAFLVAAALGLWVLKILIKTVSTIVATKKSLHNKYFSKT